MNYIWIGGTGRSGTTALWRAFQQHRDVATTQAEWHIFSDPRGALHLMEAASKFDRHQLDPAVEGFLDMVDHWAPQLQDKCGDVRPRCQRFAAEIQMGNNAIEASRALISDLVVQSFEVTKENASKGWYCEKTPGNLLAVRALLRVFPESRFIHIKRKPSEVIESWSRMTWCPVGSDIERVGQYLETSWYGPWAEVRDWARHQENYFELKLEDACREPGVTMRVLGDFIGLKPFRYDNPFGSDKITRIDDHPKRELLERLGAGFEDLMGYGWNNKELIEQECS